MSSDPSTLPAPSTEDERPAERRELPDEVAVQVLERQLDEERSWLDLRVRERSRMFQCVRQGAGAFALLELCVAPPGSSLIGATAVGACVGLVWHRLNAGQVLAPTIAVTTSAVHQIVLGNVLGLFFAPIVLGAISAWLGMRSDTRPYDS